MRVSWPIKSCHVIFNKYRIEMVYYSGDLIDVINICVHHWYFSFHWIQIILMSNDENCGSEFIWWGWYMYLLNISIVMGTNYFNYKQRKQIHQNIGWIRIGSWKIHGLLSTYTDALSIAVNLVDVWNSLVGEPGLVTWPNVILK